MKLSEFKIGDFFWTGSGKWKCFDIGTKTVIAIKWEKVIKSYTISSTDGQRTEQREVDPATASWYELDSIVLFDYDFGGCWATEQEYNEIMKPV